MNAPLCIISLEYSRFIMFFSAVVVYRQKIQFFDCFLLISTWTCRLSVRSFKFHLNGSTWIKLLNYELEHKPGRCIKITLHGNKHHHLCIAYNRLHKRTNVEHIYHLDRNVRKYFCWIKIECQNKLIFHSSWL